MVRVRGHNTLVRIFRSVCPNFVPLPEESARGRILPFAPLEFRSNVKIKLLEVPSANSKSRVVGKDRG